VSSSTRNDLTNLVKHFEGFHRVSRDTVPPTAEPYLCPAGYWTIGYGRLCAQDSPPVSMATATAWLEQDLVKFGSHVLRLISVDLSPGQLAALTSWTYNLGPGRLRSSTLRAVLNDGEYNEAPAQMRRWVYGGGVKLGGLVLRREAEVSLWMS